MNPLLLIVTFLTTSGLVLLVSLLIDGHNQRVESRLKALSEKNAPEAKQDLLGQYTQTTLSTMGNPLLPSDTEQRTRLKTRLVHAGMYSPNMLVLFLGIKMCLMALPVAIGLIAGMFDILPLSYGLSYGIIASALGMIAPGMWLDKRKRKRQSTLRRALPDALDVIVICLEGGLSLPAAFRRVVSELHLAHPTLAAEMSIVERQVQMGRSTGDALREFGERCDLEQVRTLASVLLQAERFGASLAKTLRVHAETIRTERLLQAEELAQKAAVKIVFPTILFIFPAIFLVLAGPAMIQVMEMLANMK